MKSASKAFLARRSASQRNPQGYDIRAGIAPLQFHDAPASPVPKRNRLVSDRMESGEVECAQRERKSATDRSRLIAGAMMIDLVGTPPRGHGRAI